MSGSFRYFDGQLLLADAALREEIDVLAVGKYNDPRYGDFEVTEEALDSMVREFKREGAAGRRAIDFDHKASSGDTRAAAWIQDLKRVGSKLKAVVEWTEAGRREVEGGNYRYTSAEYLDAKRSKTDGKVRKQTWLKGATLTNRPFLESLDPVVVLSEDPTVRIQLIDPAADDTGIEDASTAPAGGTPTNPTGASMPDGIAKALGLAEDATEDQILARVRTLSERPDPDKVVSLAEHEAVKATAASALEAATTATKALAEITRETTLDRLSNRFAPAERESLVQLYDLNPEAVVKLLEARTPSVKLEVVGREDALDSDGKLSESQISDTGKNVHRIALHEAALKIQAERKVSYGDALILAEQAAVA